MKHLILSCLFLCFSVNINATSVNPQVELSTSMGSVIIELYPKEAPITVENFLKYVDHGFYDETIFHRVIDNFMIQGGGFTKDMVKKETSYPIKNEAKNGLSNVFGTIAMARTNDPDSATAQFFINVANNTYLNYQSKSNQGYCVFGRVIEGVDVIQKIKKVYVENVGPYKNVPKEPILIKRARRYNIDQKESEKELMRPSKQDPLLPSI